MRWSQIVERVATVKSAVNSLGRPIATSDQGLANFWRWFGRSRVVDPHGRPLVLFHGTKADFRSFDPQRSQKPGPGGIVPSAYFFSLSADVAQSYAGQTTHDWQWIDDADADTHLKLMAAGRYEDARRLFNTRTQKKIKTWADGANVKPVYLKMEKPLRVSGRGGYWNEIPYDGDYVTTRDLIEIALSKGHDGLIITNVHDRGEGRGKPATIFAVFQPTQIKSALSNTGAYGGGDAIDEVETPT